MNDEQTDATSAGENQLAVVAEVMTGWLEEAGLLDRPCTEQDAADLHTALGTAGYSIVPNSALASSTSVGESPADELAKEISVGSNHPKITVDSLIKDMELARGRAMKRWFEDKEAAFNSVTNSIKYTADVLRIILSPAGLALAAGPVPPPGHPAARSVATGGASEEGHFNKAIKHLEKERDYLGRLIASDEPTSIENIGLRHRLLGELVEWMQSEAPAARLRDEVAAPVTYATVTQREQLNTLLAHPLIPAGQKTQVLLDILRLTEEQAAQLITELQAKQKVTPQ